jgi:hypothetical protein
MGTQLEQAKTRQSSSRSFFFIGSQQKEGQHWAAPWCVVVVL